MTRDSAARLKRLRESRSFWQGCLDRSLNAKSLRQGNKAHTEYRQLVDMLDRQIAKIEEAQDVAA